MIELENYVLKKINLFDDNDISFFRKMNQDEQFNNFFGKIDISNENKESIFMNNYILQYNNKMVGYVYIADKINNGDINAVTLYYYIDSLYRKNGIATQMVSELLKYLSEKEKINYFILNIDKKNTASICVAINNGFIKNIEDEEEIQFVNKTL